MLDSLEWSRPVESPMCVESSCGDTLVAMFDQVVVLVDHGGVPWSTLGFLIDVLGLWPSATSELLLLKMMPAELVADLCQKPSSRKTNAVVLCRLEV